ncbi:hypothetical protein CRM90_26210 [Mycobacterium sp. ENV421]|uniref:hypothetical protein n=1 Tax=Mycobacterium sp. ENV421 TaxID=1213407 RepID=UPI000C9BF314|nr:hypothetical protein CRM90_26210 [Mycobacterium sp. ENV421]
MTIAITSAEASAPIRWSCSVCDDEGVISNWADSPYDLRRRGLSLADALEEVIVSDKTAAVLRDLMLLDPDCERLVYGMRAHPNGAALLTNADDLEELIGFVAAEANHEPNRRRQDRLNAAFNVLTDAAQPLSSCTSLGPTASALGVPKHSAAKLPNPLPVAPDTISGSCKRPVA